MQNEPLKDISVQNEPVINNQLQSDSGQNQPKYLPKTLQAFKMVEAGINPKDALKYVNLKENISPEAVSHFKRKYKTNFLKHPSIVKQAGKQIERILNGEVRVLTKQAVTKLGDVIDYKEEIAPSDTNIIAVASLVYDRVDPVINHNVNVNIGVPLLDLAVYGVRSNEA
jgi:hypothetical protein